MLVFEDLVIPGLGDIVEGSLESTRTTLKISREKFIELLHAENDGIFGLLDDTLTDTVLNQVGPDYVKHQADIFQKNQRTILNEHQEMFHYFFLFVHSAHNVFERIHKTLDKQTVDVSDVTLICLLGELCRMSDEIGHALSNGATRAALAQWRTFYEHAVIGVFLMQENSPELFKKFADFSHRDVRKQSESLGIHHELLKFPPLAEDKAAAITERTEELKAAHGNDFFEDYAWAKSALKEKGRADFRKIEAQAGMSRYRPFYIWASNYTHPNFKAITHIEPDSDKIILNKITEQVFEKQSYIDPMQLTLVTFHIFLDHFLHRFSVNHQYSTNILVFRKIIDRLKEKF